MLRLLKILAASAVLTALFASVAVAQEVVDQDNPVGTAGGSRDVDQQESLGQGYIAGQTGQLTRIRVYVQPHLCQGAYSLTAVVTPRDSWDTPSLDGPTATFEGNSDTCGYRWINLEVDQPILQIAGHAYTFLFKPLEEGQPGVEFKMSNGTYGDDMDGTNPNKAILWLYFDGGWSGLGNADLPFQTIVYPDWERPTGTVLINNGETRTTTRLVTLNPSATDPEPSSGVTQMRFRNAGTDTVWSAWEPYATSRSWLLTSGEGAKRVVAQFRDAAGNRSATVYDTIRFER